MSIHTEASNSEKQSMKGATPKHVKSSGSMTIEQIQDLIANAVKAQLGECSRKTYLYTKPYTKRVDALCMPHGYQPPSSNNLMEKAVQNSVSHTSLRHATLLRLKATLW